MVPEPRRAEQLRETSGGAAQHFCAQFTSSQSTGIGSAAASIRQGESQAAGRAMRPPRYDDAHNHAAEHANRDCAWGEAMMVENQRENVRLADTQIAQIAQIAPENELVVAYGNGPQLGLLALQCSAKRTRTRPATRWTCPRADRSA